MLLYKEVTGIEVTRSEYLDKMDLVILNANESNQTKQMKMKLKNEHDFAERKLKQRGKYIRYRPLASLRRILRCATFLLSMSSFFLIKRRKGATRAMDAEVEEDDFELLYA